MVLETIRDAAHAAVFGVQCALGGACVIDDSPYLDLRLTATRPAGHYHDARGGHDYWLFRVVLFRRHNIGDDANACLEHDSRLEFKTECAASPGRT